MYAYRKGENQEVLYEGGKGKGKHGGGKNQHDNKVDKTAKKGRIRYNEGFIYAGYY